MIRIAEHELTLLSAKIVRSLEVYVGRALMNTTFEHGSNVCLGVGNDIVSS